jgi:hypothetical protein
MMINEVMEEWHRESLNTTDIKGIKLGLMQNVLAKATLFYFSIIQLCSM